MKKNNLLLSCTTFEKKIKDGIYYYTKELYDGIKNTNNVYKLQFGQNFKNKNFFLNFPYTFYALSNFFFNNKFQLNKKINIIHITDNRFIYTKIPTINTIHDIFPIEHPELAKNILRKYFYKKLFLKGINHSDKIITVSNYSANKINLLGIKSSKIEVIYNPLKRIFTSNKNLYKNEKYSKFKKKNYILVVGTISPRKNIRRILNCYFKLDKSLKNNYNLIFLGRFNYLNYKDKKYFSWSLNQKNVYHLDFIDDSQLLFFYKNASVIFFPSIYEGFGMPIIEGFASKVPVITSNFGASSEIGSNGTFNINPFSEKSMSDGLFEVLKNDSLRKTLVSNGKKLLKNFSKKEFIKRTNKVYNSLT